MVTSVTNKGLFCLSTAQKKVRAFYLHAQPLFNGLAPLSGKILDCSK